MINLLLNTRDLVHAAAHELVGRLFPGAAVQDQPPATAHRCERAARCSAAERVTGVDGKLLTRPDGKPVLAGAPSDRPLCSTCERLVATTLDDVPQLYFDLENAMRPSATASRSGRITGKSTGSPMQLNSRALHLQETVHHLLTVWEDAVRDTARLTPVLRRDEDPWERSKRRARAGTEVAAAADTLAHHLTAWTVHQPIEYAVTQSTADPDDPRADPDMNTPIYVVQAGWEAAAALINWKQHVRAALGVTNPPIRRPEPCMYCEVLAVVEINGEDLIRCESCQHSWNREEYAGKVRGFEPYLRSLAKRAKSATPGKR